jgi:hypothetical protein
MPVERGHGGGFSQPPWTNPPEVRDFGDSGDEVLGNIQGIDVIDAHSILAKQTDPATYVKTRWSGSTMIWSVSLDGAARSVTREAME